MRLSQYRLPKANEGYRARTAPNGHLVLADRLYPNRQRIPNIVSALAVALEQLNYRPYHAWQMRENCHEALWTEALQAHCQGRGTKWGREDFDRVTKSYDVCHPLPCYDLTQGRSPNSCGGSGKSDFSLRAVHSRLSNDSAS